MPSSGPETGPTRLLVVLGYSDGREDGLHPVCAARVAHAAGLAGERDAVLLSGWARRPHRSAEAELMRRAWRGPAVALHCDEEARITAENAAHAARRARSLGVREVVVVTSSWHRARARVLFRAFLPELPVTVVGVPAGGSLRHVLREAAVFPLLPLQVARARRRAGGVSGRSAAAG
ncbi:MAG TPA: YdcF family protein [Gaiellaceae bacterium]|nr:YdcF family protein [Gaiellaceae bacterium]